MRPRIRSLAAITLLFSLLLSCRVWSSAPVRVPAPALPPAAAEPPGAPAVNDRVEDLPEMPPPAQESEAIPVAHEEQGGAGPVLMGDPAGCLPADQGAALSARQRLEYADTLVKLARPLSERLLTGAWNGSTRRYLYDQEQALMLDVSDVENEYLLQRMINALHVSGFVTWLRSSERQEQGRHILALPLIDPNWAAGEWAGYIRAYWQDPIALPGEDAYIIPVLKLPPCAWMISAGFAPAVDAGWWAANRTGWPDYVSAAQAYLAGDTREANRVARQIDWLGSQLEGASTMCGPLSWSIMKDAGAFLPGTGAWTAGSKTFWLAKPTTNGRPWSLFPPGTISVYHFDEPLSQFDFSAWPLYPGDFLYTYSEKDGFDHMLVVTEVLPDGSAFTVTNLVQETPEYQLSIERRLLYHPGEPSQGLFRNEYRDRANGRTGHAGFDVMRWDWMVKDIQNQPVQHPVQPGDTLGFLSARWKTPADWIAQYNNLAPGAGLVVGQEITIPPNP